MTRKNFLKGLAGLMAAPLAVAGLAKTVKAPAVAKDTHAINDVHEQMIWGHQMAWEPAVFTKGWVLDQKYVKLKPGQIIPISQGGTIIQR